MRTTKLHGYKLVFDNQEEFHLLKNEIFTHHQYQFEIPRKKTSNNNTQNIVIIDGGAHIGLTTLYFKKLYPQATILAIEPHPINFHLLEKNIWNNNLSDITTYQYAISDSEQDHHFHQDTQFGWFSTASLHQGAWNQQQKTNHIQVHTKPLSFFLDETKISKITPNPYLIVKLDIEAAEQQALLSLKKEISLIDHFLIEFHPHPTQNLRTLLEFLQNNQFETTLWKKGKPIKLHRAKGLVMIEAIRTN